MFRCFCTWIWSSILSRPAHPPQWRNHNVLQDASLCMWRFEYLNISWIMPWQFWIAMSLETPSPNRNTAFQLQLLTTTEIKKWVEERIGASHHRAEMHSTKIGCNQTENPLSRTTTFSLACTTHTDTHTQTPGETVTIRFSISWVSRNTQCWVSGGVISATAPPSAGHCVGDAHYTTSLTGLHSANTAARCVRAFSLSFFFKNTHTRIAHFPLGQWQCNG